jgi:predicted MFS family arabinose efflux permease
MQEAVINQIWPAPVAVNPKFRTARLAVAALFFLNGALFASWVSRIPAVQAARGLSHGDLGLALLAIAFGAVVAMPLGGVLSARYGSERVAKITALLYCALTPMIILAPNTWTFVATLFLFGAFHGALDVAMNAQAVVVEKLYRQPIMSSFHALWSTGGLVGAASGGLIAAQGISPLAHLSFAALLAMVGTIVIVPRLLQGEKHPGPAEKKTGKFPLPSRGLLALGIVALCVMAGEGAMADWSAVYLRSQLQTSEGLAAAGYAAFSVAMAAGRFLGDGLSARFGPVTLVRFSGVTAAIGLSVALFFDEPKTALFGFGLVGVGFATIVPMVFTAAGRTSGISPGVALASVTSLGYLGFLAGPPVIGFVAEWIGLRGALGIIVLTSLTVAVLAPALGRRAAEK